MEVTTMAELLAKYPALAAEIKKSGYDEGLAAGKAVAIDSGALQAEQKRLLGLVAAVLGAEASDKLSKIISAGITVEQLQALTGVLGAGQAPTAGTAGAAAVAAGGEAPVDSFAKTQAAILEMLGKIHTDGISAGHSGGGEKDYLTLVAELQTLHPKMSKIEALQQVATRYPKAHAAYISAAQKQPAGVTDNTTMH